MRKIGIHTKNIRVVCINRSFFINIYFQLASEVTFKETARESQ